MVSTGESRYRRHRFPVEVVEQCVWLYFRFALSYRNIEEMMAKRGVPVTYETVREWCHKFGSAYAARLKKKRARFGAKWHLDEVFIKMNGIQHYLWRAVDQNGAVIDILAQAAPGPLGSFAFLSQVTPYGRKSTARHHHGQATELCCSEEADFAGRGTPTAPLSEQPSVNSHQPTRMRERQMKRFQSPKQAQRFLCAFESINAILSLAPTSPLRSPPSAAAQASVSLWNKTAIAALLP